MKGPEALGVIRLLESNQLAPVATGRSSDLFAPDAEQCRAVLEEGLGGRRILAIGGAGSIGAATVALLARYRPHALHVVDQDENALAELVRDLRSGADTFDVSDFKAVPLDYGAPLMRRFLQENGPHDLILNFAALKHVRSEKDACSLLQLLDTNLLKQARLMAWLEAAQAEGRFFSVSTDKAANPVNAMGASKRIMEHLIFSRALAPDLAVKATSARFANVAFSAGSLLEGFLNRMKKRQPLAVPRDARRYFVSLREAGQICIMAAAVAPPDHVLVPRLEPDRDLRDLHIIAADLLSLLGLSARFYEDGQVARDAVEPDLAKGAYPVLLTTLDTVGEKPFEEFLGAGERVVDIGLRSLAAIPYVPTSPAALRQFMDRLEASASGRAVPSKAEVLSWLQEVVPEFHHSDTPRHLDQRM